MSAMKKLFIVVSHPDVVNVISELIYLSCFEPIEVSLDFVPADLMRLYKVEKIELENYSANMDSLTVLATQYTYTLIGWVTAQREAEIESVLSGFTCSYGFSDPTLEDGDDIPTLMKFPAVFAKIRGGGSKRIFEPLAKSSQL